MRELWIASLSKLLIAARFAPPLRYTMNVARITLFALALTTFAACAQTKPPPSTERRETCNGNDDDLDGRTDEGNECVAGVIEGCEGGGSRTCTAACEWTSCGGVCDPGEMVPCGNCGVLVCNADRAWGTCQAQGECSPGEEQSCESGSQICNAGCRWDACVNPDCAAGETRSCGACGTSTCTESGWGPCEDELECVPETTQGCALGGMQTCSNACVWGECTGQGMCFPGTTRNCERCGMQTCGEDYMWGECSEQGECQAGETEACGLADSGIRTCGTECSWTECMGEGDCEDGAERECGTFCGMQTCVSNRWSECTTDGNCVPGSESACGLGGTQTCDAECQWGNCVGEGVCSPGDTEPCGDCGTRTCSGDYEWGACEGEGVCATGASQSCGAGGSQTCDSACMWGPCEGEGECSAGATQPCGNCGMQTCGSDNSWGACEGSGICAPGDTMACGVGGERTCSASCEFGPCDAQTTALQFEDQTAFVAQDPAFDLSGDFTIEAWIRANSTQTSHTPTIIGANHWASSTQEGWSFFLNLEAAYLGSICLGNGAEEFPIVGTDVRDGLWHHVAVVRDGSTLFYYLDGIEDGSRSAPTGTLSSRDVYLGSGRGVNWTGRRFRGDMHSVRVWNIARTASQILNNRSPSGPETSTGLVAHWRMTEGSGQTVEDSAGDHDAALGLTTASEAIDPTWITLP